MIEKNEMPDLRFIAAMERICSDDPSINSPKVWFWLETRGATRERLAEECEKPTWPGRKPRFDLCPPRDSDLWRMYVAMEDNV